MKTLCVILARAGSKGLPGKNETNVAGEPMLAWTIRNAFGPFNVGKIDDIVLSTDGQTLADIGRRFKINVIQRPDDLASDTATVDAAARHAVQTYEAEHETTVDIVVILYANIPVRPADLIERAVAKLKATGADSVQSVAPVGKHHPYWMKTLGGPDGDQLEHYQPNNIYRRQELPPVYQLDGGIIAVTRDSLFTVVEGEPHAFLGNDRRAVITEPGAVVDVDEAKDLALAEAILEDHPVVHEEFESFLNQKESTEFTIAGRRINHDDAPAYIIAEIGVNHDGQLDRALDLTRLAKDVGADAIKLQLFNGKNLLSAEAELAGYQEGVADDPFALLDALQLGVDDMLKVKALAHELGLGFIVTPFSLQDIDDLKRLDPDAVKIASPDCVNVPLLRAARALGKPMLISTGAASLDELKTVNATGLYEGAVMMQCVSSYPVPEGQEGIHGMCDLDELDTVRPWVVGYSDHTDDIATGMLAVEFGASILERHLTYNRSATGPDHAASLDGAGFTRYIELIRIEEKRQAIGPYDGKIVQPCEADVRRVSRQSLCAVRDLPAGHVLTADDLTVKRPGTGIPAARFDEAIGFQLNRDIQANHLLHEGDIDLP
ncbi:MAG: N-acetylneuraminate synthase family protein [Planctomycetota bacterium]|jgi:sialic acid synthase SpsE/CMP-N-acetylneuraminic acid synthetase